MSGRFLLAAIFSAALSASGALAQSQIAPVQSTAPASPQSAQAATGGEAANRTPANPTPTANDERGPDNWMSSDVWATFNGDLKAQKYSLATQITPDNVGRLKKAWETHTGDVSDGGGDKPTTVWSATPLFVNDTVYLGTPFYRILALEPDSGKVKWTFNPHATLKALTQPDLKNRGVAYWQAEDPQVGQSLREDRLYRHDGRQALRRRCRHRQTLPELRQERHGGRQPVEHGQRQMAAVAAAAADGLSRHPVSRLGGPGLDGLRRSARRGVRARRPHRQPSNGRSTPSRTPRPPRPARRTSGPRCRSIRRRACSTFRSVRRARIFMAATARRSFRSPPPSRRSIRRRARSSGAGSSFITTSGITTPIPRRF